MRFRYGEFATPGSAIDTPGGQAQVGEVEDYLRTVPAAPAVIAGLPADFDQDNDIDGFDFLAWQRNMGMASTPAPTQSHGNANGDTMVNNSDLTAWKQGFGSTGGAAVVVGSGNFDGDYDSDGDDFLAFQRNFGASSGATLNLGDGNGDGRVNSADFDAWAGEFGEIDEEAAAFGDLPEASNNDPITTPRSLGSPRSDAGGVGQLTDVVGLTVNGVLTIDVGGMSSEVGALRATKRDYVHTVLATTATRALADYDFLRRDRAFDDLVEARRRRELRAELLGESEASVEECDDAFAALADHFERPLR
jgi:hypothetical protein